NVSIGSGLFTLKAEQSVNDIRTGTAAPLGLVLVSYGGTSFQLEFFIPPAGAAGGNISNVRLSNGASAVITGRGAAIKVGSGTGGSGGNINGLVIAASPGATFIQCGEGGSTVSGKGGAGGSITGCRVAVLGKITSGPAMLAGPGGASQNGSGGAGGSISSSSYTLHGSALGFSALAGGRRSTTRCG